MKTPETQKKDALERIAAALERLAPGASEDADMLLSPAYVWRDRHLRAVPALDAQPLELFVGTEAQRTALLENTRRHAEGLPAHDVLLWGSRGMGKSGLVKAVVAALQAQEKNIALIEVERDDIIDIAPLLHRLGRLERRFILFCDDLSFETDESHYRRLRSVLEGGVEPRPANCRFYVTSNRRHLVPREMRENELHDSVNARDVLDDRLALADRFGLSLGFHACDQATYVAIVGAYAARYDLEFDAKDAVTWATGRGARSGRVAWQYIQELAGQQGKRL